MEEKVISKNMKNSSPVDGSRLDVHTLGRSNTNRVHSEFDSVMATVETRVDDALLAGRENLAFPRM